MRGQQVGGLATSERGRHAWGEQVSRGNILIDGDGGYTQGGGALSKA